MAADTKILRAIRRQNAIATGNLAAYRMVGKRIPAKKGKGSYVRKGKYQHND
jgi:stalled ribosome alternative rescue factor ArfA